MPFWLPKGTSLCSGDGIFRLVVGLGEKMSRSRSRGRRGSRGNGEDLGIFTGWGWGWELDFIIGLLSFILDILEKNFVRLNFDCGADEFK